MFVFNLYVFGYALFTYNNYLFGGTHYLFAVGLYDNSGYFYHEAANYLDQKYGPDINTYIYSNTDSFKPFYKGNLSTDRDFYTNYVVSSSNKSSPCSTIKSFGTREFQHVLVKKCL
jgi:hypothetical protein